MTIHKYSYYLFLGLFLFFGFGKFGYAQNEFPVSPPVIYDEGSDRQNGVSAPPAVDYLEGSGMPAANVSNPSTPINTSGPKSTFLDVLDLKDMDILDVLKMIAKRTGFNIVANQSVKGRISIYLKNIEMLDALKIIVESYGWAYVKDGEVIKVMSDKDFEDKYGFKFGNDFETRIKQLIYVPSTDAQAILIQLKTMSGKVIADSKSNTLILIDTPKILDEMERLLTQLDVPIKTEVFTLSYATAEEVSNKIIETLTAGIGKMKFDVRSNRLVVSDTERKIEEIRQIVKAFDEKDKQVNIEAKIIQVTLDDNYRMGIDWQAIVENYNNMELTGDFDVLGSTDKRGKLSIGTISEDNYSVVLEALNSVGITDLLSSPHIATVNNKEAKILVGSTEPYVTTTTTTPSSGPTTTAETVNFIEVGVKLYVTPMIHEDNFISLKIKPEVSSVVRSLQTSNNNTIPVVGTTQAETTVNVKDGVTIVIGGLMEEKKTRTTNKIPLLGDIPVIRHAFSNVSDRVVKSEIVVFLTPRIMTGDLAEDVLEEAKKE